MLSSIYEANIHLPPSSLKYCLKVCLRRPLHSAELFPGHRATALGTGSLLRVKQGHLAIDHRDASSLGHNYLLPSLLLRLGRIAQELFICKYIICMSIKANQCKETHSFQECLRRVLPIPEGTQWGDGAPQAPTHPLT